LALLDDGIHQYHNPDAVIAWVETVIGLTIDSLKNPGEGGLSHSLFG
jgi:hypothetical protein